MHVVCGTYSFLIPAKLLVWLCYEVRDFKFSSNKWVPSARGLV